MPHRHGYQGRKLHRETDQRRALMKGLATSLIEHETIETTHAKAKELVPYIERLITKAKKGDLHNRRMVINATQTVAAAHKLVDEIAPKLSGRTSGHVRVVRTRLRRGDNSQLSRISFVDDLQEAPVAKSAAAAKPAAKTVAPKAEKAEKADKAEKTSKATESTSSKADDKETK